MKVTDHGSRKVLPLRSTVLFLVGVALFALGVAMAVCSDFGVSPVSTVPYVASLISGISVGMATAMLFVGFVGIQWLLLREDFKPKEGLQLVFAFVFGSCVDIFLYILNRHMPQGRVVAFMWLIVGTVLIAFGIFLILKANLIVSPTDGLVKAIAKRSGIAFSKVKVAMDLGCAILSAGMSWLFLGQVYGVGIGTILSALSVGTLIQLFENTMGDRIRETLQYS